MNNIVSTTPPLSLPLRAIYSASLLLLSRSLDAQAVKRPEVLYELRPETIGALTIGRITGAVLGANGTIVIAHDADPTLLLVDRSGKAIARAGRRGRGPGEVGQALALMRCGDELFLQHNSGREFARFSDKLQFLGSIRVATPPGESPYQTVCNAQRMLAHVGFPRVDASEESPIRTGLSRVWLTDSTGAIAFSSTVEAVGHFFAPPGGPPQMPLPLGRRPSVALTNTSLLIIGQDSSIVQRFSLAGVPQGSVRISHAPRRLSPADRMRGVQDVLKMVPPMAHKSLEPALTAAVAGVASSPACHLASAGATAWTECLDTRNRDGQTLSFLSDGRSGGDPLALSHYEWPVDARDNAILAIVRDERTGEEWLRVLKRKP